MNAFMLRSLRCPLCGGGFTPFKAGPVGREMEYGVLTCYCGGYPIVAGIPVLRRGVLSETGQTAERVIHLIKTGRCNEALFSLISPETPALAPEWMRALPSIKGVRRLKRLVHERALREWRGRATALSNPEGKAAAREALRFHIRRYHDYFIYRFGQPRHLVALSFCSLIREPQRPLLDVACGCGHMTYSLTQRAEGQPVIGVDQLFKELYIARHWVAPAAEYVCCDADASLPFEDGTFSVAFCSDAFHYFPRKTIGFREQTRVIADDGLVVLVWIHNALAGPESDNDLPLPPEGYDALASRFPHCLVGATGVLTRYLQKRGPLLARTAGVDHLAHEPRLCLVASRREDVFRDHGRFEDWPHASGHLALNPLFTQNGKSGGGSVLLKRRYPSAHHEEQHAESRDYLPETVEIPQGMLADLEGGKRTPEMEKWIDRCVVLGMPRNYL